MIKTCTPMHLNESHGQKKVVFNLLTRLLTNFLYNILYKLTVGSPKTRLEFIKDVTDPLDSDYKEIEAFSVASNNGASCEYTWEKIKKIS